MKSDRDGNDAYDNEPMVSIDYSATLKRPATITALEHWRSCKGDRIMPTRSDIVPSALRRVLPQIALLDLPPAGGDPAAYAVRLAGDAIQQVFGPLTGRPLPEFLPPDVLARWVQCFDAARTSVAPVSVTSRVAYQNKHWLQAEVVIAPLGEGSEVSMLFAAVDTWPANEA